MDFVLIYALIIVTLFTIIRVYIKGNILEPSFLLSVLFLLMFSIGFFKYKIYSSEFLMPINDQDVSVYLIMALLSYIFALLGWKLGKKSKVKKSNNIYNYKNTYLLLLAIFFALIAIVSHHLLVSMAGGYASFYAVSHMAALGSQLSGLPVIYMFGLSLGSISVLFSVLAIFNNRSKKINKRILLFAIFLTILYLIPQLLSGDRGEMIKIVLIWLLSISIYTAWRPPKTTFILIGLIVALFFMGAGVWRQHLNINSNLSDIEFKKSIAYVLSSEGTYKGDLFFLSTYLIKNANEQQTFGFGLGYYNYFLHISVPKTLIPFKEDLYIYDAMKKLKTSTNYNVGSTFDGIADAYVELFIFSPFVWLVYFFILARAQKKFINTNYDIWNVLVYVLMYINIIWLFSHGTVGAIGNLLFTLIIVSVILNFRKKVGVAG